jgi:hypothetical protein
MQKNANVQRTLAHESTEGVPGWRPIETAPVSSSEDQQSVMLWVSDGGSSGAGCCAFGRCYRVFPDSPVRVAAIGFYGDWKITHWMPLPNPPETTP